MLGQIVNKDLIQDLIQNISINISRNYFDSIPYEKIKGKKLLDGKMIEFIMYPPTQKTYDKIKFIIQCYIQVHL